MKHQIPQVAGTATDDGDAAGPWLLRHRVELPDPVTGYVERPELEELCAPVERRLTVLHAPGGFGKTALLARCCRSLRERGVAVAWLALDENDGPVALATYLVFAFEQAGLDTLDVRAGRGESGGSRAADPEADSRATYRINMLVRVIEDHAAPCVLALDELERLDDPDSVALLNAFLRAAPRNLHFAMSFRARPPGLDIAMFMLEGTGATVTTDELRFSTPDIARFFGRELSRRELAKVASSSVGWPIALRIYRSARESGSTFTDVGDDDDMVAAWIEARLWRGLSDEDRDFVLDMALFDWIDATLIDEATGARNSERRIESMESLAGLLETRGDESTVHLHPLIRDYCANRRFREDPHRFRKIHAAIARALASRGQVVEALRHAAEAGDTRLIAAIAEEAGGIKIWFRRGFDALRAVDGWLTSDIVETCPRLASGAVRGACDVGGCGRRRPAVPGDGCGAAEHLRPSAGRGGTRAAGRPSAGAWPAARLRVRSRHRIRGAGRCLARPGARTGGRPVDARLDETRAVPDSGRDDRIRTGP